MVLTAAALPPIRQAWDEIFGPNEAQLVIVSAAPIRNVSVTYDGRTIEPRPGWPTRDVHGYAAFPAMRTRIFEPVLHVSWEGPSGPLSVSRIMRQADSGRVCLYVLNLDNAGVPVGPEPPGALSPFWWTCHSR
ncbi:MAG: hypothetical protein K2X49_17010 [Acetobacteraceae bacterium]|nr:hypothetical protein [Acetobacteraceae bacterium]